MRPDPTTLVCATIVVCTTIVGAVILAVTGSDFSQFRAVVGTICSAVAAVGGIGGWLSAGAAARSAEDVRTRLTPTDTTDVPPRG